MTIFFHQAHRRFFTRFVVWLVTVISSLYFVSPVKSQGTVFDVDLLISQPGLWELNSKQLSELASRDGTEKTTFLNWSETEEGGRRAATFPHQGATHVEGIVFGGIPISYLVIEYQNDRLVDLTVICRLPNPQGAQDKSIYNAHLEHCKKSLASVLDVQPIVQNRYHGSTFILAVKTLVYLGKQGAASLDYSPELNVLRFSLAPPGTSALGLLSESLPELDLNASKFFCDLDVILKLPDLWRLSPKDLESAFDMHDGIGSPCFQWLTSQKDSARFAKQPYSDVQNNLMLFGRKIAVDEVIINFQNDKVSQVDISIFNRGDSGDISKEQFVKIHQVAGQSLSQLLAVRPVERKMVTRTAVKTSGWVWTSPHTLALLECNAEGLNKPGQAEFMRLKLAPPERRNEFIGSLGYLPSAANRNDLVKAVRREANGDVYVSGVPMVDQGAKGYCVVASCQRLFSFMRIQCDQHELAQMSGSNAALGTSSGAFIETLRKIDDRFQVRFKPLLEKEPLEKSNVRLANPALFKRMIEEYTGKGLPLLWALELGLFPENPDTAMQSGGLHMRLIIGYNSTTHELLFSDSWGAGHELKRMKMEDALNATMGIYLVEPR